MKEVEIENRTQSVGDGEKDFFMVDLSVDGQKIETGDNPISSYSFWSDMEDQTQRALFRIKKNNPTMKFEFSLQSMMMSKEQIEQAFRNHVKSKYPSVDVDKICDLLEKEVASIEFTGPDDDHPNPFLKSELNSHLTKNVLISVIDKYLNPENSKEEELEKNEQ